jgi:hypothetical protein
MQFGKNYQVKICHYGKDGGQESRVWGFWFIGIKSLFSVALLRFEDGSREAYHSHAFNCVSWVLRGRLVEKHYRGGVNVHKAGLKPVVTRRSTFHKVESRGRTWVLTFRGPWSDTWQEFLPEQRRFVTLTHGRQEVA